MEGKRKEPGRQREKERQKKETESSKKKGEMIETPMS